MQQLASTALYKVAEMELVYKSTAKTEERIAVSDSSIAYKILKEHWDYNKIELVEQFKILLLDRSGRCLGISEVSSGGISHCQVDPKIVFATALKAKASQIILAHNHPSGNLQPSPNDISLTKRLVQGGEILAITVPEHIIMTSETYYSFADNGLMP